MLTIKNSQATRIWNADLWDIPRGQWVVAASKEEQERNTLYYCYRTPEEGLSACDWMIVAFVDHEGNPGWAMRNIEFWAKLRRQWRHLNPEEHIELVLRSGKSWEAPKVSKC